MLSAKRESHLSIIDDFVRHLEGEIADLKAELEPLESGRMFLYRGPSGSQLKDITAEEIGKLKSSIRSIEAVLAQYRKKE
jgi:hypothetical protein